MFERTRSQVVFYAAVHKHVALEVIPNHQPAEPPPDAAASSVEFDPLALSARRSSDNTPVGCAWLASLAGVRFRGYVVDEHNH